MHMQSKQQMQVHRNLVVLSMVEIMVEVNHLHDLVNVIEMIMSFIMYSYLNHIVNLNFRKVEIDVEIIHNFS